MFFAILLILLLLVFPPVSPTKIVMAIASSRILIELRKINFSLAANTVFSRHAPILIIVGF